MLLFFHVQRLLSAPEPGVISHVHGTVPKDSVVLCCLPLQLKSLQTEQQESAAAAAARAQASPSLQLHTFVPMEAPAVEQCALGMVGIVGGQSCQPAPAPEAVEKLLALCPSETGSAFVCFVLQGRCLGDLEVRAGSEVGFLCQD